MKKLQSIICLIGLLVCFTSCLDKSESDEIKLVTADEMQSILEMEDVQLVDVRTPEEYQEVRIANAQNIDFLSPTFSFDFIMMIPFFIKNDGICIPFKIRD